MACQQFASKVRRDLQRGVGATFAHFTFKRLQTLHFSHHAKRLRVHEAIDQLTTLNGAILVQNNQRHVFHVVVEGVAERNHLDQWRKKHEEERHRIAPDHDEFLEENCAEPAKKSVRHIFIGRSSRAKRGSPHMLKKHRR